MDLRAKTCCFTGHRSLSGEEKLKVAVRLRKIIEEQIKAGIVFYGAGGALGFDTLAAQTVLDMKKEYPQLRPILVLPWKIRPEDGEVRILRFLRISSEEAIRLCMCPGNTPRTVCTAATAIWWITAEPVSAI